MNFDKILNKYICLSLHNTLLALLLIEPLPAVALDSFSINDYTDIAQANQDARARITITNNITLESYLPVITTSNISFLGNGNTISGNNNNEDFNINDGTVSFSNLTITHYTRRLRRHQWWWRRYWARRCGGLFINAGSVMLNNVTFSGNQAVGDDDVKSGGNLHCGGGGGSLNGNIFFKGSGGNNSATGGASGGYGATNGQGLGGAIFIANGATVTSIGIPEFSSNTASTSNNDYYDTITIDNKAPVPVPEPLTNLGTIIGASFGVAMRRRFVRG